jgi:hypothetical protein
VPTLFSGPQQEVGGDCPIRLPTCHPFWPML